jgi:hypothetical protein
LIPERDDGKNEGVENEVKLIPGSESLLESEIFVSRSILEDMSLNKTLFRRILIEKESSTCVCLWTTMDIKVNKRECLQQDPYNMLIPSRDKEPMIAFSSGEIPCGRIYLLYQTLH